MAASLFFFSEGKQKTIDSLPFEGLETINLHGTQKFLFLLRLKRDLFKFNYNNPRFHEFIHRVTQIAV